MSLQPISVTKPIPHADTGVWGDKQNTANDTFQNAINAIITGPLPMVWQDTNGPTYAPTKINFTGGTGALTYNATTKVLSVNVAPKDVRQGVVASTFTTASQVHTPRTVIPDFTLPLAAGDNFIFDMYIPIYSNSTANASVELLFPSAALFNFTMWGPDPLQTSYDITKMRISQIDGPALNGPQSFGGYTSPTALSMSSVQVHGEVRMPTGATAGSMTVGFAQMTPTSGTNTTVRPLFAHYVYSRQYS